MSRYQRTMRDALQSVADGQTEFDEAVKWEVKITGKMMKMMKIGMMMKTNNFLTVNKLKRAVKTALFNTKPF